MMDWYNIVTAYLTAGTSLLVSMTWGAYLVSNYEAMDGRDRCMHIIVVVASFVLFLSFAAFIQVPDDGIQLRLLFFRPATLVLLAAMAGIKIKLPNKR
jgi:hypothetical protein